MLAGELYNAGDPELVAGRERAMQLCSELGLARNDAQRREVLTALFGRESDIVVTPPFHCDYGTHIRLGRGVYFNAHCSVLDVAPVTLGDHVLIGPAVQLCTAGHPLDAALRRQGQEFGRPIVIEDDVWLGAGVIVCPGVRIGARSVVGAGSVVTRDLPPDVLALGNPCRVVRSLTPADRDG